MLGMDIHDALELVDAIQSRLDLLREALLAESPKATAAALAKVEAGVCTFCSQHLEPGDKVRRGAHENSCYRKAMRRVEKGDITDAALVAAGLLLPAEKPGKRVDPNDPVRQLIEKEIASVKKRLPKSASRSRKKGKGS